MRALKAIGAFILYIVVTEFLHGLLQYAILKSHLYTPGNGFNAPDFILSDGLGIVVATFTAWIAAKIEKRRFTDYGIPPRRSAAPQLIEGFLWGIGVPVLAAVLVIACGGGSYHGFALHGDVLLRSAVIWLVAMLILGFYEEWTFRGYAFNVLTRGIGFWPAAAINAIGFGALHYFSKPMENAADFIGVAVITLFMCITIWRTGALWFAIGFHAAFDYFALIVLAAPNTGNMGKPLEDHLLDIRYTGADWLTGGPRGLEASVPMLVVVVVAIALYFMRTRSSNRSPAAS
ncbi:MAG TPA: CPBP family intramembrane glutamic endopeptidase [Vicinamibacterales bacterium]